MAQLRDSGTGRFTKAPANSAANDAALKAMLKASTALVGFTKTATTKVAPVGRAAIGAAGFVGSTGLRGAKGVGGIINTRRKEAGFTQAGMNDKLLGNRPILHAMAGGGMDIMNLAGRGAKAGLKGVGKGVGKGIKGIGGMLPTWDKDQGWIKKKKPEDSADPKKEKPESTENQREDRALIEKISDNVEKIAAREGGEGTGDAKPKAKAGGILGMIAGLGGMLAMGPGGGILGKVFGGIGGIFKKLGEIAKAIPGLISKAMPFLKTGADFFKQMFKKLFWPVTAIIGILSFVDGFIAGYKEGGLVEGFKQGIESLFNNLIDVPLNMLKDAVAWIMGALGFENIEKALNSFDVDFSSLWGDAFQMIVNFLTDMPDMMMSLFIKIAKPVQDLINRWGGSITIADDMQAKLDKKTAEKKAARAEKAKRTEERRAGKAEEPSPSVEYAYMKKWSVPKGTYDNEYTDDETGLTFIDSDDYDMAVEGWEQQQKAAQIEAKGGTKGAFEQGKLVSVDGKPYDAPTPIAPATPAARKDARAGAATSIQNAGIASGGGGGPIVIPAPGGGGGGGGGASKPVPLPIPLEIKTDPTLAIPAQF